MRISRTAAWVILAGAASALYAQTITQVGGCPTGPQGPLITGGITVSTNSQGFPLCVIGNGFQPALGPTLKWVNTTSGISFTFPAGGVAITPTSMQTTVPANLYTGTVNPNSPDNVQIVVTQGANQATGSFLVNPTLKAGGPVFLGPVGAQITGTMYTLGTPPYTNVLNSGSGPSGFPSFPPNNSTWAGTPNTAGAYTFSFTATDAWGAKITPSESFYIVPLPHVTGLNPSTVIAGAGQLNLTINGSGFVAPVTVQNVAEPGSSASLNQTPVNVTNFGANSLTAVVPASLTGNTGSYLVTVTNPSPVSSTEQIKFQVVPGINSINPTTRTAGTAAFPLQVIGAGFQNLSKIAFGNQVLATSFDGVSTLTATVPATAIVSPGSVPITVQNPDGTVSAGTPFTILAQPLITGLSPSQVVAGAPNTLLTINGNNFTPTMSVNWNGNALAGVGFGGVTQLTVTIPASFLKTAGNNNVTVSTTDGFVTPAQTFIVLAALTITSNNLPNGLTGVPYNFPLSASGGVAPYTWSATNLPQGINISTAGVLSGTPTQPGVTQVNITVKDASNTIASATLPITITVPPNQLQISSFPTLPGGTVGVPYTTIITATGGAPPYSFSLFGSSLPAGLNIDPGGTISGTPIAAGNFQFTLQVTDSKLAIATQTATLNVIASPLIVTTASTATAPTGKPFSLQFAASGGVPPYTFAEVGALPPGLQFSTAGLLSGTPTTVGAYPFVVFANDTIQGSAKLNFSITITLPALTITTQSPLPAGLIGTNYSVQLNATGGTTPYRWSATGLPQGLTIANINGLITGIPTQSGSFNVAVTVADSNPAAIVSTTQNFSLTIAATKLTITNTSLPNGIVGVAYNGSFGVSGGIPPYSLTVTGLPQGIIMSAAGALSGTPTTAGTFTVNLSVQDAGNQTANASFTVTVASSLVITSTGATGILGTPLSVKLAASGGTPPYNFVATGLPGGVTLAQDGTLSGTPTASGTFTVSVTVTDSTGVSATKSIQVTVSVPTAPPVTLNLVGLSDTPPPASQSSVHPVLGSAYPLAITVKLTMTVKINTTSGTDDPTYQFASGGRTAQTTINAGSTAPVSDIPLQLGTLPATVTITAQLLAGTQDVTPAPAPTHVITVNATAPVITKITATRTGGGFHVTITGFSPPQNVSTANFQFSAASGATLVTTSLSLPVTAIFNPWFTGSSSAPYGAAFTWDQDFAVTGGSGPSGVASLTVTMVNSIGTSASANATLQ